MPLAVLDQLQPVLLYVSDGFNAVPWGGAALSNVTVVVPTQVVQGKTTVTTAGTPVVLGTAAIKSVTIKALIANTGTIYVGANGVTATNGFPLLAGDTLGLDIASLSAIWVNSSVSSEGVNYVAVL